MKLNREQIIKALECCNGEHYCNSCPYYGNCYDGKVTENALSLIKKLTKENERLRADREIGKELFYNWKKLADETADRLEVLYQDAKKALVTDTVRKMRSEIEARCVKGGIYPAFVKNIVNEVAEEILKQTETD